MPPFSHFGVALLSKGVTYLSQIPIESGGGLFYQKRRGGYYEKNFIEPPRLFFCHSVRTPRHFASFLLLHKLGNFTTHFEHISPLCQRRHINLRRRFANQNLLSQ